MNREKALLKNTAIIAFGKICTQLITFFLLPLYTGILSTEEYGIVDFLNTLISLLLPIVTFQVEKALFRELIEYRDSEKDKVSVISNSIFSVIAQCVLYLVVFLVISNFINNKYKYFLASNVIAYIFSSLFLQVARGLGENRKYAIGSFISALLTIIFNVLFLVIVKLGANGMLLGTLLGHLSCVIYLFISLKIYKYINIKVLSKKVIKRLWKYSIPLIPNAISWWVFNASDKFIVTTLLGVGQNGILAASLKFSAVYISLYNMFDMSWTESIALHIDDKDISDYFNKTFDVILRIFIALAVGIISCMPFVFPIMINAKFNDGFKLVPISVLASLFNVVVGIISVIYVAKKNTKAIANTSTISAIINIIVHLGLIHFVGLYAAVISTFVSFFVMSIYRVVDINKKYFKIRISKELIVKTLIVLPIILLAYYMNNLIFNVIAVIIAILFAFDLNKNSFGIIVKLIKKKFRGVI